MTVSKLIEILQGLPPYADVLFDDIDVEEYCDIAIEQGDDYPETRTGLVLIKRVPE